MPRLFDEEAENEAALQDFYSTVPSGGDVPVSLPTVRPVSMAEVKQPVSIMDRMKSLGQALITPRDPELGHLSSPLYGIGQLIAGVGAGIQGKGGEFWAGQTEMAEKIRAGSASRLMEKAKLGLDIEKHELAVKRSKREDRLEQLKEQAYAEIEQLSLDPKNLEPDNLWKLAGPLIKAGDKDAGIGLLRLGIEARGNQALRTELTQMQIALGTAKTREEADAILGSLSPELTKAHGDFLMKLVNRRFPDDKTKGIQTNELADFVATEGKQRGPSISADLPLPEAKKMLAERRSIQQQQIILTTGQQQYRREADIREDFAKQTSRYRLQREEYAKLLNVASQKTPVSDIALIYQTMKAIDPTSTVREREADMVAEARQNPLFAGMLPYLQMRIKNQKLTPTQRKEVVDVATGYYSGSRKRNYEEQREYYEDVARRTPGVDVERALGKELPSLVREQPSTKKEATKPAGKEQRLKALGF